MTATAVDERSPTPGPRWAPSAPPTVFPLTERRRVVLADDPCEAGFSGADPEYAGIYLHARYFDPKLGVFLSPDPIGVAGGMNLYGYAFGNPVNGTDRSGLLLDAGCWLWQRTVAWGGGREWFEYECVASSGGWGSGTSGSGTSGDGREYGGTPPGQPAGQPEKDKDKDKDKNKDDDTGDETTCASPHSTDESSFLVQFVDASAGFGDALLFGFGDELRDLGTDVGVLPAAGVDTSSAAYEGGSWTGVVASFATGVVGGLKAAGTRAAGLEFSHWIPARLGGPRTILNGNYVTPLRHAMHDPYRYLKGMSKADKLSPFLQQADRMPRVYAGAVAGATAATAGRRGTQCK